MARLNIPDEPTFQTFTVTTAQAVFPFGFPIFARADVSVDVGGVVLDQSAFTFSGTLLESGGFQGGTVTLNTAVSNTTVTVYELWRALARPTSRQQTPSPWDRSIRP